MVSLNSLIQTGSRRFLLNKLPKFNSSSPLKAQNQISVAAFSSTTWREPFQARYANDITSLNNQRTGCTGINLMPKRFKKTKGRGSKKQDEDEDDDDDDDEDVEENPLLMDDLDGSSKDFERLVIDVNSLRLDAFAKVAFGATRLKIEESFYKGDLLVNGERASKKSQDLHLHDEIDLIKGINTDDRSKIEIKRVQIESMPDKATEQGRMKITIKRWFALTVDAPDRAGKDDD